MTAKVKQSFVKLFNLPGIFDITQILKITPHNKTCNNFMPLIYTSNPMKVNKTIDHTQVKRKRYHRAASFVYFRNRSIDANNRL